MARKSFKAGALTAPVPPVLVTVGNGEQANIITIGWTGILATHPPRTYISVRPERHSHALLRECGEFVIHLARASMAREVDLCGIYSGAKVDKFSACNFTRVASKEVCAPTIAECPVALECRVREVIPMGTHDVFVADILSVSCDEEIIDERGGMRFDRAGLLAYAHGEYYALGERLGRIGFSTDKPSSKRTKAQGIADSSKTQTEGAESGDPHRAGGKTKSAPKAKRASAGGRAQSKEKGGGSGEGATHPFYSDLPRKYKNKKGGTRKK